MAVSPEVVRALSSGRWLIPILASMAEEAGSRFSGLARRLDMSRSVLSASLDSLERLGWIARNPGHGHPLRPEYMLTDAGIPIAAWCAQVMAQRRALGLDGPMFGRWSLPIMFELGSGWARFTALQRALMPVTPRSLTLALDQMRDGRLVERRGGQAEPPLYGLSDRGRRFAAPLRAAP